MAKLELSPFVEVVTDEKLNEFVVKLCKKEYRNSEEVMDVSIGHVTYVCGESHVLVYSEHYETFNIIDNGQKELPGFHCPTEVF